MKRQSIFLAGLFMFSLLMVPAFAQEKATADKDGWISLMDGKSFDGWKVSQDNPNTFQVKDGAFVANGKVAHLFYDGSVNNHNFKNFELKVDVMTKANSNGGIYFGTEYQEKGFPNKGNEIQVNQTHSDPVKSGSIYNVVKVFKQYVKDDAWYTTHIVVVGKHVWIYLNDEKVVDYEEPADMKGPRKISSGTFALQGHDPGSTSFYKNIRVKPLPDDFQGNPVKEVKTK